LAAARLPPSLGLVRSKEKAVQNSDAHNRAIGAIVDLVATHASADRAVHPETAIASAARLAGSLLFRSFDLKLDGVEPGTVALSHEANEKGPQLINIMAAALQKFGVTLDPEKLGGESTMSGDEPELTVVQSLSRLQDDAVRIAHEHGLDLEEAAQAVAIATGVIVKECESTIGGEVGFNIAALGFIEGCKTVPPPRKPRESTDEKKP
jgi:hypothetical protein